VISKRPNSVEAREQFVKAALSKAESFTKLCGRFGISRMSGYRWVAHFEAGGRADLADRARGPKPKEAGERTRRWREAVLALRHQHRYWGAKKIRAQLVRQHPRARLPSERTIARMLRERGLVAIRKRRRQPGPLVPALIRTEPERCNGVWTVDFKGHFKTGDGTLCRPLTVRDLYSRYLLLVEHVEQPSDGAVRKAMEPCFRRCGLPRVIRVDNGAPFASSGGALNLSALSVWWTRLGIGVEFTRRGKPQDNGAHEQMHRVLKQETARPPARTLAEQGERMRDFVTDYNEVRPHQALAMRRPAEIYRKSPRIYAAPCALNYRATWQTRRVTTQGVIKWAGRIWHIGRAFARERIGLKSILGPAQAPQVVDVYLGRQLIGQLHRDELSGMRPAQRRKKPGAEKPA
jgi:transposase InsO family protein